MTYVIQKPNPQVNGQQLQQQLTQPLQSGSKPSVGTATTGKSAGPVPQRWAGPAFSNSPAPDALPVPSFMASSGSLTTTATAQPPGGDAGAEIMQMLGQQSQSPPQQQSIGGGGADIMATVSYTHLTLPTILLV